LVERFARRHDFGAEPVTLSRKQNHRVVIEKEGIPPAGTHLPKLNG
jgi:hypothetical protein